MKKVIGFGGIFIKSNDHAATKAWYQEHLGVDIGEWGAMFKFSEEPNPEAYSILSLFKSESDYFAPSEQPFMLNLRVADLNALVAALRNQGVALIGEPVDEEYGKFAWIVDPNGIKIELWEQPTPN
jgi:predicted enzyme related to lactoylglutathione lyase